MTVLTTAGRRALCCLVCCMLLAVCMPSAALADAEANGNDVPDNVYEPLVFDEPGTPPTEVADVFDGISPNLRLEAFPVYIGRVGKLEWWKFTLYGTENLLTQMKDKLTDKKKPFPFRYVMEIQGDTDVSLVGNIAYGVNRGEDFAEVTRFNMALTVGDYRYAQNIHCKRSVENQLSWLVEMPRSAHFDIDRVTGYRLSIYNADKRLERLVYEFNPDILTDTALYTPTRRGCTLKLDMPTKQDMTLTILDPRLPDGYTNSPGGEGTIRPYWKAKIVLNSQEWFEVVLDGVNNKPQDAMHLYCGHYVRKPDDSNKYSPRSETLQTAADCSYRIDDDRIAITLRYPDDRPVDFTYIDYILLDMSNGVVFRTNQYPLF